MLYEVRTDEKLMCLKSEKGPSTASRAFDILESRLEKIRGRRFYGLYREEGGHEEYYACVRAEEGDDPEKSGLHGMSLPMGRYDKELLRDWSDRWDGKDIEGLPGLINKMVERNRGSIDGGRFTIEYYRSQKELYIMLPIK